MKTKSRQHNRFLRIIALPIRALGKARDAYVKGMINYAGRMGNYSNSMLGIPSNASEFSGLAKSFSVNTTSTRSRDEDSRELLIAASARSHIGRTNGRVQHMDTYIKYHRHQNTKSKGSMMMPRSSSVVMGRIDEDKPCSDFGDDSIFGVKNDYNRMKNPRSRSINGGNLARNGRSIAF